MPDMDFPRSGPGGVRSPFDDGKFGRRMLTAGLGGATLKVVADRAVLGANALLEGSPPVPQRRVRRPEGRLPSCRIEWRLGTDFVRPPAAALERCGPIAFPGQEAPSASLRTHMIKPWLSSARRT